MIRPITGFMGYADNAVHNGRGVLSLILNIPILKMGKNLKNLYTQQ